MATRKTLYDAGEEKLVFINEFIIDQCLRIEPDLKVENLAGSGRLKAIEIEQGKYIYYFDNKYPLLYVDLNLLIDGT